MRKCRKGNAKETAFKNYCKSLGVRVFEAFGLPGTPDAVSKKHKVAIFFHGCFWHGCPKHHRLPKTNAAYWKKKVEQNKKRDARAAAELEKRGWKVVVVWECEFDGGGIEKLLSALGKKKADTKTISIA